jgi:hypothetical protein
METVADQDARSALSLEPCYRPRAIPEIGFRQSVCQKATLRLCGISAVRLVGRLSRKVEFERVGLLKVVNFHQTDAGRVVLSAHDRGVVARSQSCDQGRFQVIVRWSCRGADVSLL